MHMLTTTWFWFCLSLALENVRLAKECNEHRAARGFEPLPTFKV